LFHERRLVFLDPEPCAQRGRRVFESLSSHQSYQKNKKGARRKRKAWRGNGGHKVYKEESILALILAQVI